jgi:FdhD protein
MNRPLARPLDSALSRPVGVTSLETSRQRDPIVCVAEEAPVAFRYNGFAHAVMMATPASLEDFAVGFSLTEGVIEAAADIGDIVILSGEKGISVDISLGGRSLRRYLAARRIHRLRGNTGCGLCGIEDLDDMAKPISRIREPAQPLAADVILCAVERLREWQPLSRLTRGAHAAAWVLRDGSIGTVREDVGRHNALDKLIGAALRGGVACEGGFCLITSRCSFEMVQKAASAGYSSLVSVSSPTALAIEAARRAGLSLYALSRDGAPLLFTAPELLRNKPWQPSAN